MNQFARIHNQFTAIKRAFICDFDGEQYTPVEMHVLGLLARNAHLTVSDIASLLYITKSAVSQTIKKLVLKGLVQKERDTENERIVKLIITPRGDDAVSRFTAYKMRTYADFFEGFQDMQSADVQVVSSYMNKLEQMFKKKLG